MPATKTSKWDAFKNTGKYSLEDLGRPALFLIPSQKLKKKIGNETVEKNLERFLVKHFGAFTTLPVPKLGFWINGRKTYYDECREYKVSFAGKKRIPLLLKKLASVARLIGEKAIYLEAGQYACVIKPKKRP